jgi:hypothetical protein
MRLGDLATVIRSKNAGAFDITIDIFFPDRETYSSIKQSGLLAPSLIAQLYHISPEDIRSIHWYGEVNAVKVTVPRRLSCGEPGDTDVYACQQYAPLWYVEVPQTVSKGLMSPASRRSS